MKDNTFEKLPEVMSDDKDFDTMVETLEENEDMVECKECFELFPKADCARVEHGYICPTCGQGIIHEDGPEVSTSDITVDLYDQDFPDAIDYDPDVAPMVAERAADFKDMFDALLKDEFAAIDGYDVAIEAADHSDLKNREEVIDTLDHIRAEEEEHIDELRDLCPECENTDDDDDDEEEGQTLEALEESAALAGIAATAASGILVDVVKRIIDKIGSYKKESKWIDYKKYIIEKTPDKKVNIWDINGKQLFSDLKTVRAAKQKIKTLPKPTKKDPAPVKPETEEKDTEPKDLEEELFKLTGDPAIDKYNNAVRYAKRDKVPYLYGYTKADGEAFFPVRPVKIEGDQAEFEKKYREENPDAGTLRIAYPDKSFRESIGPLGGKPIWFCYFNGKDLGTVEADTEDEAFLEMERTWPEYQYNNSDATVVPATEEEMEDLLYESYKHLFEQKLEELWTYPKAGKTVDKICKTNGYTIAILGEDGTVASASTKRTARTLKDALTTAQNLSKLEPDEIVYVIANAIPETELKMLPKPFLKFFDQKPGSKYAIVLTRFFRGAEDENSSKIRAFHNNYATAVNVTKQSKDAGAEPEADIRGGEEETPVEETFKVTFDSAEGSAVEAAEVKKGEKVAKPADPSREGHTFKGWFNGETEFDFDTAITADITLTAKWEAVTPDADPADEPGDGILDLDEEAPAVPAEVAELLDKTLGDASAKYYFRLYDAEGAMSGKTKVFGPLTKVLEYLTKGAGKSAKATLFYPVDIMATVMGDKAADIVAWFNANLKDLKDPTGKANPKKAILLTNFNEGVRVEDGDDNLTIIINKFAEFKAIVDKEAVPGEVDDDESGEEEPPVTEPKTFIVTFTDDGKSTEVTVNEGEKVAKPADPTREGFEFKGWFNGEAAYEIGRASCRERVFLDV